jgi:hypothetical protein
MSISETFANTVNQLTPDLGPLYEGSKSYDLDNWKFQQRALVGASGGAAVAIPGLHLVGLAADAAFLVNRMGVASYGVGAIIGADSGAGNILEHDDFPCVLAYWSGERDITNALKGKAAADLSTKVGTKFGTKFVGKAFTKGVVKVLLSSSGYMVGQKLGGKFMAKASAKFAAKFAAKTAGGFIVILGPAVGAGVNIWLINSIIDAAEEYYRDKLAVACR